MTEKTCDEITWCNNWISIIQLHLIDAMKKQGTSGTNEHANMQKNKTSQ